MEASGHDNNSAGTHWILSVRWDWNSPCLLRAAKKRHINNCKIKQDELSATTEFLNGQNPAGVQQKENFTLLKGAFSKKVVFRNEYLSVCSWYFKDNVIILEKWKYRICVRIRKRCTFKIFLFWNNYRFVKVAKIMQNVCICLLPNFL